MAPEGVFPYAAWARTLRRVLADESERTVLEASGPQGSPRLRAAIAAHLRGFRGMEVHPDQIVIGSGAQSLYGLLVLSLIHICVFEHIGRRGGSGVGGARGFPGCSGL